MFMISGFSKPRKPLFTYFIIPKCFTKYKKNWDILETYYFCKYENTQLSKLPERLKHLFASSLFIFYIKSYLIYIIVCEDEDRKMMPIALIKSTKA